MIEFEPRSSHKPEAHSISGHLQTENCPEVQVPQEKMFSVRAIVAREVSANNHQVLEARVGSVHISSSAKQNEFLSFSGAVRDAGKYIKGAFVIPWVPVKMTLDWLYKNNLYFLIFLPPFNVYVGTQAMLALVLNAILVPLAVSSALIGTVLIGLGSLLKSALR